jgi:hypothetical protein
MAPDADRRDQDPCTLLAAYELGLLDAGDRRRFEAHLSECAGCPDSLFQNSVEVATLLENRPQMLGALARGQSRPRARFFPELARRLRSLGLPSAAQRWWLPLGAAATAVVALSLFVFHSSPPPSVRSLAQVVPVPYTPMELRAGAADDLFREGMEQYAKGEYGEAVRTLRGCERLDLGRALPGGECGVHFFLGLALLLSGQADSALVPLTRAGESPIRVLRDRSRWYLAQAYLQQEDSRRAEPLLMALADSSPVYAIPARRQLAELRNLALK